VRRRTFITLLGGAVATWPLAARAQQPAMPVIGFLNSRSAGEFPHLLSAFRRGLNETGYAEGRNVMVEYRWAEGRYDRLPGLADELVRRRAAVIVAIALPAVLAAKAATNTIPVLFFSGVDPVTAGLVASFNRPGGNLTGVSLVITELEAKRLELMRELMPNATTVAALINPNNPNTNLETTDLISAARTLGLQIKIVNASSEREIQAAFAGLVQSRPDFLIIGSDPFFLSRHDQLVALTARHGIPAIFFAREFVAAGGLISYGASLVAQFRDLGMYAGKILRGAKPSELPVIQPTKFELVINLKTAWALRLTVPPTLLARADEVIE
jgi:ABC-type uncharacterized transport system substrate-binding protein